jgi:glycosyltransferase involved in cell wall biosynthesis
LTNRLRVLQIGKFYSPFRGGIETYLQDQSEALLPHVDLRVIVANAGRSLSRETVNGVAVTRLPTWTTISGAPVCPGMVREIPESRADIVQLHLPNPAAVLAYLASGHSGTLICHYHSDIVRQKWLGRAFQPILRHILNRADAIIVSSVNYLESSTILRPVRDRCRVIPYGIVLKKFDRPDAAEVRAIRERFGPRIVIAVGRMVYYKGFEYLIRAMSKVDATLLLVGTGHLHDALLGEIEKRGLEGRVHLLGDVESGRLPDFYHAADLMVLPSLARSEAFGIVQLEAMACGKPVVNTSLDSGVPFVSRNGVTGITVPPKDSDALASAIQLLLENEAMRKSYGEAARRRVHEIFTMEAVTDSLLGLYGQLNPPFDALAPHHIRSLTS